MNESVDRSLDHSQQSIRPCMPPPVTDDQNIPSGIVGIVDTVGQTALLLRRFEADRDFPGQWCFPGGQALPGEPTKEAAEREALEETGLTVGRLEYVGRRDSIGATGTHFLIDCFLTQTWAGSMLTYPSAEHEAAAWVPLQDLSHLGPTGKATRWLALAICAWFTGVE